MAADEKTVALNFRIPASLKDRLEDTAIRRKRQTGERVTMTDLIVEALEALVSADEKQDGASG